MEELKVSLLADAITLTDAENTAIQVCMQTPALRLYLREVANNAARDAFRLRFERPEDQLKLAARYGKVQGVVEFVELLLSIQPPEKETKK